MQLQGDLVYLRALEPDDSEFLLSWENNVRNWQVSDTMMPFSRYAIEQFVSSQQDIYTAKQLRLIICLNETSEPIGTLDLYDYNPQHGRAGIGILIAEESMRKKGYASQAVEIALNYCFTILFLNQVYCQVMADNEASLNLFLKQGFQIVGVLKQWRRLASGYTDEYFLQCLNHHYSG